MWVKMEDRCGTTDGNVYFSINHSIIGVPNFDPYPSDCMVISDDFMEKSGLLFPITNVRLVPNGQLYYNAPWKGVTGIPHGFTL